MDSDLEYISGVLNGNKSDFGEIVKRYQKPLLRLILRMTRDLTLAEDIVQEAFIKAYQNLHTFEGKSTFKSWMFQIAINTMRNKLRGFKMELVPIESADLVAHSDIEENIAKGDLRELITTEIDKLPPRQKLAISLRIFEDLSFKEIAEIMQCPYDTAKANFRHGFLKLKEELGKIVDLTTNSTPELREVQFVEVKS